MGVKEGDVDIAKRRPRNDVFEIWSVEPLSLFTFGDLTRVDVDMSIFKGWRWPREMWVKREGGEEEEEEEGINSE